MNKSDKAAYRKDLGRLITAVKELGEPLGPVDIVQSDLIFPPEDLSFEEAKRVFSGTGKASLSCAEDGTLAMAMMVFRGLA